MPSKPVETTAASGGKQVSAAGISLTFPADWTTIDMTQGDLEKALAPLGKQPNGDQMLKAARTVAQSGLVKMMVFDPTSSKPGFVNNANVVVTPANGVTSIDMALDASKKQLEAMGKQASTSKVTFPAGEFGRFESHLNAPDGKPYVAIGYLQINGDNLDVVTFSCPEEQAKTFDAKAQEIMKSFKRG